MAKAKSGSIVANAMTNARTNAKDSNNTPPTINNYVSKHAPTSGSGAHQDARRKKSRKDIVNLRKGKYDSLSYHSAQTLVEMLEYLQQINECDDDELSDDDKELELVIDQINEAFNVWQHLKKGANQLKSLANANNVRKVLSYA